MEIITKNYSLIYDRSTKVITCEGSLRLKGTEEYLPIINILNNVIEQEPPEVILNLEKLQFLNSSGLSILSKFIINVRKKKNIQMVVLGSKDIPWQQTSLKNLQRLMPALKLEFI
ncbi:MAG: hypothetical protein QNJ41_02050 [Xenococcaceae cyanobacterium MO_188.B32]|nr:hypothetical protein [Xenococcaceae cyanobacterium MO_188.B32]